MPIRQLEHTLQAYRPRNDLPTITNTMKHDMALTLLEASRFQGKPWKIYTLSYNSGMIAYATSVAAETVFANFRRRGQPRANFTKTHVGGGRSQLYDRFSGKIAVFPLAALLSFL